MSYVKSFSARYADEGTIHEQLTKIFPMVTGIAIIVRKHLPSNPIGSKTARHSLTPHPVPARPLHLHHAERAHRCTLGHRNLGQASSQQCLTPYRMRRGPSKLL
jgi:hypothetical protein